jgi:LmbE family N-acetylglucosaminyl deacetylase
MIARKPFLVLLFLCAAAPVFAQPAPLADIELGLRKLSETGTVLMIAAHPDDERTNVLAYFARGRHMRTGYLSITRGEGGQNLIGSDQGANLGVIRTQELLAARRIDGAEQFFTRAIDFGFTNNVPETMEKWGHDGVLSDIVWVIRRYRPDVIILGFSGTPADGHGQHQASALLGKEAFEAAADPAKFPEQLRYVQPWKTAKLVYAGGFGGGRGGQQSPPPIAPAFPFNTTGYNTILGYTYDQLANISRSQHRSQGFGAILTGQQQGPGGNPNNQAPPAAPPADLFEGIGHSWGRYPGGAQLDLLLNQAIREFDPEHPDRTLPLLAKARPLIASVADPIGRVKLAEIDELIAQCSGLWAEAQIRQAEVVPGAKLPVGILIYPRLPVPMTVESVKAEGVWNASDDAKLAPRPAGGMMGTFDLNIPAAQTYSQPYWLRKPALDGRYQLDDQMLVGDADTPVERVRIHMTLAGIPIEITRRIENISVERAEVARYRPLTVIPPVAIGFPSQTAVFATAMARKISATVTANIPNASGTLRLDLPAGWKSSPASAAFSIAEQGASREIEFTVTPPAADSTGSLRAVAKVGEREVSVGRQVIDYPHIPVEVLFPPAEIHVVRADIKLTSKRIGYIMGAGDEVPAALKQLGLDVTLLSEDDLVKSDLSRFDAIVAGVRAYNVRPDLRAAHSRLMEYVNKGGTYLVQYQSPGLGSENIGPYPIKLPATVAAGNSWRVTMEDAPVTFTHPDSRLLQFPNHITQKDFEGWVQERGILFATEWDPRYETVLASGDPGQKQLEGGELWTHYGKGVYIFSSWVWFRELPAGVPGAYRLFANMLSAK